MSRNKHKKEAGILNYFLLKSIKKELNFMTSLKNLNFYGFYFETLIYGSS